MNQSDYIQPPLLNQAVSENSNRGLIYSLALFAVLTFIFLIPWGNGLWDGLTRVFGILAFAAAALLFVVEGTHKNYTYFHFFAFALWAWVLLSTIWSPNLDKGTEMAGRVFQVMLLPLLFTLVIDNRKSIIYAYQSYVLGNIIGSSIIIYNYLNGIQSPYYNRYTIPNFETDEMSIFLALAIPMAAYLASILDKKWKRLINLFAMPLIIFAIFLTGTRTGSIVAVIGILYWLFTHRKASFRIKASILIVFILSIITVASFAPKASLDRVFSAGKSLKSGNLNYRTVVWKASIKEWKTSPVIGVGLGGLGDVLSKDHVNFDAAHNTYIHIMTENGIIGLTIYLLLIVSMLYLILQAPLSEKAFLLSLLMIILVSQLTLHTHILKSTWFVFSMLVIHAINSYNSNQMQSR
jgi:O-antigen ligase